MDGGPSISGERIGYVANDSFARRDPDGTVVYIVAEVHAHTPGYRPAAEFGSEEAARSYVSRRNEELGITDLEAYMIMITSIAAGKPR